MKKFLLLTGTALLLAGCNQGGSGDDYNSGSGTDAGGGTNYSSGTNDSSFRGNSTTPGDQLPGSTTNSESMGGTNATGTDGNAGGEMGGGAVTP